jgi:transcriptional regulator with XRE-family HTH domain
MHMAEVAFRIRQARKARGITQAALASRARISRVMLNQLESGKAPDLGLAKVLRLLRALDLDMVLVEGPPRSATDYVRLAAVAGSTGFRESLDEEEVVRALLTGRAPPRKRPHLRRLLEDSPDRLIEGLVAQVSQWNAREKVEKNLAALAKSLDVQLRPQWTKHA